ncbi:MAG: glycosyltransferase family 39 protein [Bryobacterales bacterium]|nr:glycosyltransferase family 39 protein [Bryobacterales bacterium]
MPYKIAGAALVIATLILGISGMRRSLWLDEAWVANSIHAPTIGQMFYYPNWLQSSPPLFLLASRAAVQAFGLSSLSLRMVPLLMALVATVAFFLAANRVLSGPFAILAASLLVFFTAEVEYSHTAKQYSGEVAMSSLILLMAISYLQKPDQRRFVWLCAVTAAALPFAYSSAFMLPAVVLAVYFKDRRNAAQLAALTGGVLAILYIFFIRQNVASELRRYWISDSDTGFTRGAVIVLAIAVATTVLNRNWIQMLCLMPCLLLAAAAALHWYPLSYRTRLFVVPGFILMITMAAENLCRGIFSNRRTAEAIAWVLIGLAVVLGVRSQILAQPGLPKEDVDGAVRFLQSAVSPNDLLLLHPSVGESFRLYAAMDQWSAPPVVYGDTGWPCCPRGKDARPMSSTNDAVVRDLRRMIPTGYSGLIWLLYTIRPTHWDWVGFDESKLWRSYLAGHGCQVSRPNRSFENLAITVATCDKVR